MRRVDRGAGPSRETLAKCIPVRRVVVTASTPAGHHLDEFHLGASVHTSDGHHVGTLQRIVVDGDTWDPHALIVKESEAFAGTALAPGSGMLVTEVIVPLNAVASITPGDVHLKLDKRATRALPPYLSYHYKPLQPGDTWRYAAALFGQSPGVFPQLDITADKSPGDIEIRHGENVMIGHLGDKLGTVQDVLFDGGELVGIVVRPTGFFAHDVIVQVRFLDRSDDAALFLRMTKEDVVKLAEFDAHS
jgi:sporulation protein YlmC with PRC-barrel domain